MELEISIDEFRAFLAANPERKFYAVRACDCPLAGFLNKDNPPRTWSVTCTWCRRDGIEWFNPQWAKKFVLSVDRTRHIGDTITGAEALKVLAHIEA